MALGLRVLIVHGACDAVVPLENSRRLAARLNAHKATALMASTTKAQAQASAVAPAEAEAQVGAEVQPRATATSAVGSRAEGGAALVEVLGAGHLPHEEWPEAFAGLVGDFLAGAVAGAEVLDRKRA